MKTEDTTLPEDTAQPATTITEIAREGNFILVIGPQQKRIRVCSVVLSNVSRPFHTMFDRCFGEGENVILNPSNPKEMEMPDDDAENIELICNIIHLRHDRIPAELAPQELLKFLVTAEKFDCLQALQFISRIWLARDCHDQCRVPEDIAALIITACVLDDASSFKKATLQYILHWDGSFINLPTRDIHLSIDLVWNITYALAEGRTQFYTRLMDIQSEQLEGIGSHALGCKLNTTSITVSNELLREGVSGQDLRTNTIWDTYKRIASLGVTTEYMPNCCPDILSGLAKKRRLGFKKLRNSGGLCLDCMRSRSTGNTIPCRVEHD